jgi:hypothetical protein
VHAKVGRHLLISWFVSGDLAIDLVSRTSYFRVRYAT